MSSTSKPGSTGRVAFDGTVADRATAVVARRDEARLRAVLCETDFQLMVGSVNGGPVTRDRSDTVPTRPAAPMSDSRRTAPGSSRSTTPTGPPGCSIPTGGPGTKLDYAAITPPTWQVLGALTSPSPRPGGRLTRMVVGRRHVRLTKVKPPEPDRAPYSVSAAT